MSVAFQPVSLTVSCEDSLWRLDLVGDLEATSSQGILNAVGVLAAARVAVVEIDLSGVSFVDLSGLRLLETAGQQLDGAGVAWSIRSPSSAIVDLLHRLGSSLPTAVG